MEAVVFYWPAYRIAGLLKLATALISCVTMLTLWRVLPNALKLPSLIAANEELRRTDTAKNEFLANMSHEIRTPMTAILGYADLLLESESETKRSEYAATIRRNGEHLLAVLNDILDLSKIEAGKYEFESVPCNLHGLLDEVIELQSVRSKSDDRSDHSNATVRPPGRLLVDR